MWACVLISGDADPGPVSANGVTIVPGSDPVAVCDAVGLLGVRFVVLAAPLALAEQTRAAATVSAGRWPEVHSAVLISEHAPLALYAALSAARGVTNEAGLAAGYLRTFLACSWSGAWVSSVAKLSNPAPTIGQHVRSLLPGSGFLVRQSPEPAVVRPRQRGLVPSGPGSNLARVLLTEAGELPNAVIGEVDRASGATAVRQIDLPGNWQGVYGARAAQLALVPAQPRMLPLAASHHCPSCELSITTEVCPYCHVMGSPLTHSGGQL